jgi:antagonist of KipI
MSAGMTRAIEVIRPGMLSTLQDLGRLGQQHLGIVPGGVMDSMSHRLANALVGNDLAEASLEITLLGPELLFHETLLIALSGARFDAQLDGQPLPLDRPVLVRKGARLKCGRALRGARAYLAVCGGFAVAPILNSRSTYLPAGFGGTEGRALLKGDHLPVTANADGLSGLRFARLAPRPGKNSVPWWAPGSHLDGPQPLTVQAMPGHHFHCFTERSRESLFGRTWTVGRDSNRMGFRLEGPTLERETPGDIISGPACLGTVQVPAAGQPIILMADHQTTGGYAKILEVASADVCALAQLAPGTTLRFESCTLEHALQRRRRDDAELAIKIASIRAKFGSAPSTL